MDDCSNGFEETRIVTNGTHDKEETVTALLKIEKTKNTNTFYCMFTLLVTTGSTMMSIGLAVGALNPTLIIMSGFYNETYMMRFGEPIPESKLELFKALTVSMLLAGGFIGALSLGFFVRNLTRKRAMQVINSINIGAVALVSIGGYCIPSYEAIIIGRFFMGFVSGIGMNVIPMVTAETSTKSKVAFYLSLIGVDLSFGGLVGLVLGYHKVLGNETLWPILLATPALPSIFYLISSPFLPETPSYLLLVGEKKKAFETLKKLRNYSSESQLLEELVLIQQEQDSHGKNTHSVKIKEMFLHSGYRRQLFLVIMVFLESQLCGINGIGMYTDVIFVQAGISKEYVTFASMVVYSVQFLVALAGSKAVDKWGPRRLSVFWSLMMSLSLTLLTVSMTTYKSAPGMAVVSVVAVTLYVLSWACGPNITLFPLISALTTEPTREASFKIGGGLFWIASWFVGFVPLYFMQLMGPYAFLPWAISNYLFTVFFYFKIPETRGKSVEEIQAFVQGRKRGTRQNGESPTETF